MYTHRLPLDSAPPPYFFGRVACYDKDVDVSPVLLHSILPRPPYFVRLVAFYMIKLLMFTRFCCILWAGHNSPTPYFVRRVEFYDKDVDSSTALLHSMGRPPTHTFRLTCCIL